MLLVSDSREAESGRVHEVKTSLGNKEGRRGGMKEGGHSFRD
jgi:hypothetical protein